MSLPVDAAELPLSFAANHGQSARVVSFLAQGAGYGIFLAPRRAVLDLDAGGAAAGGATTLSLSFLDADPEPVIAGSGRRAGSASYIGEDGTAIHSPSFTAVRYSDPWPRIGMRFHGGEGHLEYDFELGVGADPRRIALRFAGQRALRRGADGSLLLRLGDRWIRQLRPHAFQAIDGIRQAVSSRYVIDGSGRIGIALGPYDHSRPLTIDPRLIYSTYLGRGVKGWANSVAAGPGGDAYLTGATPSSEFPTTIGTRPILERRRVAFVAKVDPTRNRIVYSTFLGDGSGSQGEAITVDAAGDAFVAGTTRSPSFHTKGAFIPRKAGENGVFVAKLDPDGQRLLYSAYLGRRGGDSGIQGLALDRSGNAYVAGMTTAKRFPTTAGAFQRTALHAGEIDDTAFIAKLDRTGSHLDYSTYLSGSGESHDPLEGLAVDPSGHAYVTGRAQSEDFPTTPEAFETRLEGPHHEGVFVAKLNRTGSRLAYSTFLSGGSGDEGAAIALDAKGRAYIAGASESRLYPTTRGAHQRTRIGSRDIIVSVLSPDGSRLEASTYLGARSAHGFASEGTAIGLEPDGDVVVAAITNSAGFATTADALQPEGHSPWYDNSVIAKFTPDLRRLPYLSYFSGRTVTRVRSLAISPDGRVLVAGGSNPGLPQSTAHLPRSEAPHTSRHPNAFVGEFGL